MTLKLSPGLSLPLDVVTQAIAILAKRRAGKSYTMRRLVEQLLHAKQQVVLVDPKGDQWGIRSSADGKGPGYPVVILGGEHGDVPLEKDGGELVAKLVVEEGVSAVLDLSQFRKGELAVFMASFLENLYRLKAQERYRTPVMLVIDEADAIAPQRPQKGEERMLGAAEDIVRRGGQRGIGCCLISQRSAVLNKNVLTQAQILIVLRTIAPQDLVAMKAWVDVHGTEDQGAELMDSLPSLPVGDCWVWSPGWPTEAGIFKRVHVLPIETFDSGKSPEPGEKRIEPKQAADVDLEALKRQMAETVEKAKANDPRELRKQLQAQAVELAKLRKLPAPETSVAKEVIKEVSVVDQVDRKMVREATDKVLHEIATIRRTLENVFVELGPLKHVADAIYSHDQGTLRTVRASHGREAVASARSPKPQPAGSTPATVASPGDPSVGNSGLRRILIALAQRNGLTRRQLGVRACLSSRSGTFDTYLSRGRTNGWIGGDKNRIEITDAGLAALGAYDPLPTGQALLEHWLGELGQSGAARILRALADVYPHALNRHDLGLAAGLSDRSGTFDTYLSRLRTLELIEGKGELRASEELF